VFVTEPVEYNFSSIAFDTTKKDMIPGDIEIKCLLLELMEGLNFLHSNAKTIHANLSPENIYVTKEGKLRIAGLNFA
jgi:SCY1-like protein 2